MPSGAQKTKRYIIMPASGFTDESLLATNLQPSLRSLAVTARPEAVSRPRMRVLDAIPDNGPKLVEMPPEGELSLRLSVPGIKIVPEVFFHKQWYRPRIASEPASAHRLSAVR